MIKAIKVDNGLIYFCGVCDQRMERMTIRTCILLDDIDHVILRCPVCFTLASVMKKDCCN